MQRLDTRPLGGGTCRDTGGDPADTIEQTARDTIAFVTALGLAQLDLLGFSIGSFVAQDIALRRTPG